MATERERRTLTRHLLPLPHTGHDNVWQAKGVPASASSPPQMPALGRSARVMHKCTNWGHGARRMPQGGLVSHPRPLPAELGPEFSVRTAAGAGVSYRRLRHRSLDAPFRGARMQGALRTPDPDHDASPLAVEAAALRAEITRRARAYATIASVYAFFSHVTAAVLWGLPLPIRVLRSARGTDGSSRVRDLDVSVVAPHRAPRMPGVRGRQLSPALTAVRTHNGLRLSSPAATWAALASELTIDELVELGDAIVHIPRVPMNGQMVRGVERSGLATVAQLTAALGAGRRIGIAKLREALPLIRVGSASPPETRLRLACMRRGLPEPELDYDVIGPDGGMIGYTELAHERFSILIEYEGDHHRTDREQWNRDIEKHAACVAAGWTVLRLTSGHMRQDAEPAVGRIREALLRAGWRP